MRQAFDIKQAMPAAWKLLWADNLRKRLAGEDFRGNTTYLCAGDLVEQVRRFAQEQSEGKAWGSTGRQWGRSMAMIRISTGRPGGLLSVAREWLFAEVRAGRLEEFDFGRGHISGARFRPRGAGATEREKKTIAERERRRSTPRPKHASRSGSYGGRPLCSKKAQRFSGRSNHNVWTTSVRADVTCPRCLKMLESQEMPKPVVLSED